MGQKKKGPRDGAPNGSPKSNRANEGDSGTRAGNTTELPEHLEAVRVWIASGGHNRPEVAEAVARRILERGELRDERDGDGTRLFGRPDSLIH
jgi:hypothetical protein